MVRIVCLGESREKCFGTSPCGKTSRGLFCYYRGDIGERDVPIAAPFLADEFLINVGHGDFVVVFNAEKYICGVGVVLSSFGVGRTHSTSVVCAGICEGSGGVIAEIVDGGDPAFHGNVGVSSVALMLNVSPGISLIGSVW